MIYGLKLLEDIDAFTFAEDVSDFLTDFLSKVKFRTFESGPAIYGLSSIDGETVYYAKYLELQRQNDVILTIENELSHDILRFIAIPREHITIKQAANLISPQKIHKIETFRWEQYSSAY